MSERRSRLRRLALDYADGQLDRDTYVRARTQFLDALSATTPGEDVTTTTVLVELPTALVEPPTGTMPTTTEPTHRAGPRALFPILGIGAGALLAAAIGIWLLTGGAPTPPTADHGAASNAGPNAAPGKLPVAATPTATGLTDTAPPSPTARLAGPAAETLIEQLLAQNDWGTTERARFIAAWRAQGRDEDVRARKSHAFQNLKDELRVRIETRDAAGGNDTEVAALLAFGQEIGADLGEPASVGDDNARPVHAAPVPTHRLAAQPPRPITFDAQHRARPDGAAAPGPSVSRQPEPTERPRGPAGGPAAPDGAAASELSTAPGAPEVRPPVSATTSDSEPPMKTAKAPAPAASEPAAETAPLVDGKPAAGPRPLTEDQASIQSTPAAPAEPTAESRVPRPSAAAVAAAPTLPALAERLTGRAADDPCASAAKRAPGPGYPCSDRFSDSATATPPRLLVVPAATPFAITDKQYTADALAQWCARSSQACVVNGAAATDDQTKAVALAAWLAKRTGKRYRPATPNEWQQAAAYGVIPRDGQTGGIRLVRELDLPTAPDEAQALEHWWRTYYRPSP